MLWGGACAGDLMVFCKVMHTLHICLSSMNAFIIPLLPYHGIYCLDYNPSASGLPLFSVHFPPFWIRLIPRDLAKWLRLKYLFMLSLFLYLKDALAHFQEPSPLKPTPKYHRCLWRRPSNVSVEASPDNFLNVIRGLLRNTGVAGTCRVLTGLCLGFFIGFSFYIIFI